jgi:hypothetical protein
MHISEVALIVNAVTAVLEVSLCALLLVRRGYQRLPFFAAYAGISLANLVIVALVYRNFGFESATAFYAYWIASGVQIFARSLAIAELCRYKLRAYRGIWSLTVLVLSMLAALFLANAAIDAYGQFRWIRPFVLTVERDLGIASAAILISLLLIRNYYGLELEELPRQITIGMCILCLVEAVGNTLMRESLLGYLSNWGQLTFVNSHIYGFWVGLHTSAFFLALGIWCFALRKPLPAPTPDPVLLPTETYRQLSPRLNFQLQAISDRLMDVLKP